MSFAGWREHFTRNRLRPMPNLDGADDGLRPGWARELARSLAVFQLGESKGGRIATEIDEIAGVDPDYRVAIKLFIEEELRHGDMLAMCVDGLHGERLSSNWTDSLFVVARRLAGLRFKLVVLLAAETVGIAFYRGLVTRLPAGPLRGCLDHLIEDETHHLRFHGDTFRGDRSFLMMWYPVVIAAAIVVLIDHRRTHRILGISVAETVARFRAHIRMVAEDLARPSTFDAGVLERRAAGVASR
jgi:hypothetical protein